MTLTFFEYELPLLKVLDSVDGTAEPKDIYPKIEDFMINKLKDHPREYESYLSGDEPIWKNKTRWAREYLKRKGQLDASVKGVWKITPAGKERLRLFDLNGKDPDEGRNVIEGIDASLAEESHDPEKVFQRYNRFQSHGDILGVKGIVYEPINEQGVVLLFAALCSELDFRIEGIQTGFPDALLIRKNRDRKRNFSKCLAEFEFKASNYKDHKHPLDGCDLIVCWENDWPDSPIEVLELKSVVSKYK